jgi:hypothetical protein
MAEAKRLSRKQLALIDDLFKSESEEQEILERHKVTRLLYRKWQADEQFTDELNRRVSAAYRRSRFVLARNAGKAAQKLAELAVGDKGETTRKACLDILAMNPSTGAAGTDSSCDGETQETSPISPQVASRLLAVLAGDDNASQEA